MLNEPELHFELQSLSWNLQIYENMGKSYDYLVCSGFFLALYNPNIDHLNDNFPIRLKQSYL